MGIKRSIKCSNPGQKEVRASIKARTSFVLILYLRKGTPHYYAAGTCTSKEARTFSVLFQLLSTGSMYLYRGAHLPGQKRYAPLWRYIPMLYLSDFVPDLYILQIAFKCNIHLALTLDIFLDMFMMTEWSKKWLKYTKCKKVQIQSQWDVFIIDFIVSKLQHSRTFIQLSVFGPKINCNNFAIIFLTCYMQ